MMCRFDTGRQSRPDSDDAMKNVLPDSSPSPFGAIGSVSPSVNPAAIADYQRIQLYDYAQVAAASRLRFAGHPAFGLPSPYSFAAGGFPAISDATGLTAYGFPSPFVRFDPRTRFVQEEPKPQHSYIGLIAMAILSSPEKKMVLSDIYQYILDQYPYFRNRGPGWRNSIRHNLSLNDCFIKAGRSANGKGHYWAIHPANIEDFKKGDFRRRKAQRKVRKHMGLSVPDDDDSPSPTPPPPAPPTQQTVPVTAGASEIGMLLCGGHNPSAAHKMLASPLLGGNHFQPRKVPMFTMAGRQKRQFDMDSLLAPDPVRASSSPGCISPHIDIESPSPKHDPMRSYASSPVVDIQEPDDEVTTERDAALEDGSQQHHANGDQVDQMRGDKDLVGPRIAVPTPTNASIRRAVQWTMSLPIQNSSGSHRLPFNALPFTVGSPCWTPAQAASFLTYSVSSGNVPGLRPSDLSVVSNPCSSTVNNPLMNRWQESIHRITADSENTQKPLEQ